MRAKSAVRVQTQVADVITFEDRIPLDERIEIRPAGLSKLFEVIGDGITEDREAIFLDVETTGLNLGAGTLVIIVGLGFVEENAFVVRQYFLHDPGAERAMLGAVSDLLARFTRVITFNGKRFDVPMLAGRYRMHRLPDPLPPSHVDVLYPARRIWRRRLHQSNLATLEARVLGITRESDVPGSEVPARYFAFLREQRSDLIGPVLGHNRQDVITLARLTGVIDELLDSHDAARNGGPSDLLGLAHLLEVAGQRDRARQYYESALVGASPGERLDALLRLATLARQAEQMDVAIQLFDVVSNYSTKRAALAAIELAKIYEHRIRHPEQALRYAKRASEVLGAENQCGRLSTVPAMKDLARRILRLEAKLTAVSRKEAPVSWHPSPLPEREG